MSEAENNKKPKLTGNFNLAADGTPDNTVPYKDWNIINMQFKEDEVGGTTAHIGSRAVNFQYILKNGDIPYYYSDLNGKSSLDFANNQWIDLNAKDALTQTLDTVQIEAEKRIRSDSELSALLEKNNWSREDRVRWEDRTSSIVSEEVDKVHGLNSYRTIGEDNNITQTPKLNDLSQDIENGTKKIEFDCKSMSVIEGITLQRLENKMLPTNTTDAENNYKNAGNYFYVGGKVAENPSKINGHAFIVSSVTGNVIESTVEGSNPYKKSLDPNHNFNDFVEGKIAPYGQEKWYYGGYLKTQNGISPERMQEAENTLQQTTLADAENKTKLLLEKAQALGGITGMDQLKEAVQILHGQDTRDPHLRDMIEDMMAQPDKAKALNELEIATLDMYKSWDSAFQAAGDDPSALSSIKSVFNLYADQMKSSLQGIPYKNSENPAYSEYLGMFVDSKINTIPDQTLSVTTPVSAPATQR